MIKGHFLDLLISRATNGTEGRARLNEAITDRHGPYVGVSWKF